jgi:hypothetical protein
MYVEVVVRLEIGQQQQQHLLLAFPPWHIASTCAKRMKLIFFLASWQLATAK